MILDAWKVVIDKDIFHHFDRRLRFSACRCCCLLFLFALASWKL